MKEQHKIPFMNTMGLLALLISGILLSGCPQQAEEGIPPPEGVQDPVALAAHPSGRYVLVANGNFFLSYRRGTLVALDTTTNTLIDDVMLEIPSFSGRLRINPEGTNAYLSSRETDEIVWFNLDTLGEADGGGVDGGGPLVDCGQPYRGVEQCSPEHRFTLQLPPGERSIQEPFELQVRDLPFQVEGVADPDDPGDDAEVTSRVLWTTWLRPGATVVLPVGGDGRVLHAPEQVEQIFRRSWLTTLTVSGDGLYGFAGTLQDQNLAYLELEPFPPDQEEWALRLDNPLQTGLRPPPIDPGRWEVRAISLSPQGDRLYTAVRNVATTGSTRPASLLVHEVIFRDDNLPELVLLAEIGLGDIPGDIGIPPWSGQAGEGYFVYVLAFESNLVQVINPATLSLEDTIRVGNGPFDITFADTPVGRRAYVASFRAGTVSVIDLDPDSDDYRTRIAEIGLD